MRTEFSIGRGATTLASVELLCLSQPAAGSDIADAVMNSDFPAMARLLEDQVDVNEAQADGTTALH